MQRTYLALSALVAGTALSALPNLPLLANTIPSRAPLGQDQATGSSRMGARDAGLMLRQAAAAIDAAEANWGNAARTPTPPPPPQISPEGSPGIVALEVLPYRATAGDS